MMMWGDGDWGWGSWAAMSLTMLVFWALLLGTIIWAIRTMTADRGTNTNASQTPNDVLAERFARGEIDEEEYRQRAAILREHR